MKIYSYVIEHDYGHAPNPYFGVCTLARCKFRKKGHPRNLVEKACIGDWVVGTGGADRRKSAGNGNIIFAMKVEDKLPLSRYWNDPKFKKKKPLMDGEYAQRRGDNKKPKSVFEENERFVLISWSEYYYFGKEAAAEAVEIPQEFHKIEKKGPGYKANFCPEFITEFLHWLKSKHKPGKHGEPWGKEFKSSREQREREACKPSC